MLLQFQDQGYDLEDRVYLEFNYFLFQVTCPLQKKNCFNSDITDILPYISSMSTSYAFKYTASYFFKQS